MAWQSFKLDQEAHDLVFNYRNQKEVLSLVFKMRAAVAYGLERFWGEQLRLDEEKARYWADTWKLLTKIMIKSGIEIPNDDISSGETTVIKKMTSKLLSFPIEQRRVSLAVLTQLCDSMIWWTQRYKLLEKRKSSDRQLSSLNSK